MLCLWRRRNPGAIAPEVESRRVQELRRYVVTPLPYLVEVQLSVRGVAGTGGKVRLALRSPYGPVPCEGAERTATGLS